MVYVPASILTSQLRPMIRDHVCQERVNVKAACANPTMAFILTAIARQRKVVTLQLTVGSGEAMELFWCSTAVAARFTYNHAATVHFLA